MYHANEARYITNTGNEIDRVHKRVGDALERQARVYSAAGPSKRNLEPELGVPVGKGAVGTVFRATVRGRLRALLEEFRMRSVSWVEHSIPREGTDVCVKVEELEPHRDMLRGFRRKAVMEATWHVHLLSARAVTLPGCAKPILAADFIPYFYWMGVMPDAHAGHAFSVTVMSCAPGMQVQSQKHILTADAYVRIEQAVASLWLNGIAHGDLHMNNVLYDPRTKHATVIDFGMAVALGTKLRDAVREKVALGIHQGVRSLGEVWLPASSSNPLGANVQAFVDRVMSKRGYTWIYPDGHALMALYGRVPRGERAAIPHLRHKLWGYSAPERRRLFAHVPTGARGNDNTSSGSSRGTASLKNPRTPVNTKNNGARKEAVNAPQAKPSWHRRVWHWMGRRR